LPFKCNLQRYTLGQLPFPKCYLSSPLFATVRL
jgi:hypothetical protein